MDDSAPSTRSSSPVNGSEQSLDIYDLTLSPWRAAVRRQTLRCVERESPIIAKMQEYIRTPFLDAYFVYTSSLGTHTFFMTVLPALFFFGYPETGRGLLLVLSLGVYVSSFVKDLVCSPRPFAPPVTRLTIGTHHLEYGFPSSHTTNSVSIALLLFSHVHRLSPSLTPPTYYTLLALILFYAFSIVYGRLYTAMHSFTDCAVGIMMGASLWWVFDEQFGLGWHSLIEGWLIKTGWPVPAILIPLCLLMVHKHPQPVDDCPCFEDAIAFIAVLIGALVARWAAFALHLPEELRMPMRAGFEGGDWQKRSMWWTTASAKMFFGIVTIFMFRIVAKSVLHLVLPPSFRLLARLFTLPHRRFYTPATQYKNVPSEFAMNKDGTGGLGGLRTVPSVIDLPAGGVGVEIGGIGDTGHHGKDLGGREVKWRGTNGSSKRVHEVKWEMGDEDEDESEHIDGSENLSESKSTVKHYDADVLTKVIVYAGIAVISTEVLPTIFDRIGWGVGVGSGAW